MVLEEPFTLHTLKTSAKVGLIATALLFFTGAGWGLGFLIGGLLSLLSLYSLVVIVPILFRPGAPAYAKGLLSLTLFMKLPFYMMALYLATHLLKTQPMALGLGVLLVPLVITLRAVGQAFLESEPITRRQTVLKAQPIQERG